MDLSAYVNTNIQIAFVGSNADGGSDGDIAIDDISLYVAPPTDLSVTGILLPESDECATTDGTAIVLLTNLGSALLDPAVDPVTVTASIGGTNYSTTYAGPPLPPGASFPVQVSNAVDLTTLESLR